MIDRRRRGALATAKKLGADITININEVDDVVAELRITGGVGVDS